MRQTILILGMHRSGTSALAGICHLLGAAPPGGMMEAAFDNPTGFWESMLITSLNETALFRDETRRIMAEAFIHALGKEYGEAPFFVLKDPRFSLLLDFWMPVFSGLGIAVAPVLALRHPAEVTASLRRRDNMPIEIAAPMWLHYTLESERRTRGRPRVVQSYERLLQDWRACMQEIAAECGLAWPTPPDAAAAQVETFLQPHMRHHHASLGKLAVGRPPVAGWIAETYDALRCLEHGESPVQYARLDQVHAAFAPWRAAAPRISMAAAGGKEPLR
jgi:hypothetical protein